MGAKILDLDDAAVAGGLSSHGPYVLVDADSEGSASPDRRAGLGYEIESLVGHCVDVALEDAEHYHRIYFVSQFDAPSLST